MDDTNIVLTQDEFNVIQNHIELIMIKLLYSSIKDPYSSTVNDRDYMIALKHIIRLGDMLQVIPKLDDENVISFDMKNLYTELKQQILDT